MFKWLLEKSLAHRLLVLVTATVLMAYGAYTLSRMPVDVFPDLNKPTVTVMTEDVWNGSDVVPGRAAVMLPANVADWNSSVQDGGRSCVHGKDISLYSTSMLRVSIFTGAGSTSGDCRAGSRLSATLPL